MTDILKARSARRHAGWRMVAAAVVVSVAGLAPAQADEKLTYFTWSGYELPDFNPAFAQAHPEGLETPIFGDDDEALTKVRAGFNPDVVHPCYDKVLRWKDAGLIQPIEIKRLTNWDKIFPSLRNLPGLVEGDKTWMVPWDWGNTSITYRTDLIPNAEKSWRLLWDPQYTGKIAVIDAVHDTPVVAAVLAGVDPFNMSDADIETVRGVLKQQRPLVKAYTTDLTSVEQQLASGELVAAMTWNASAVNLKKQGIAVEFMQPKEGMLTWVCGFVLSKSSEHVDLAYEFINSRLDTASGKALVEMYGYGTSNADAMSAVGADKLKELALPTDPEAMLKSTVFTKPINNNDAITRMFEEVKAGG